MDLPVVPPVAPMLARAVSSVPAADSVPGGLSYEPKWDGFRCIVFRDGDEIVIGSRNEKPLTRYFPDVVEAVRSELPRRCVVDGEIVVAIGGRLEFERLQERIHPADSRVRLLAETTPASLVVFDLLALGDSNLMGRPFATRRAMLEDALRSAQPPVFLTPSTRSQTQAEEWFSVFEGAGLDGLIAKGLASHYQPDKRAMFKIKHERTADCVVAGYRLHKQSTAEQPLLGSLLLGLYDDDGRLQHVGVAAAFPAAQRAALVAELRPLEEDVEDHPWADWREWAAAAPTRGQPIDRRPGNVSRWNAGKDLSFVLLAPALVVEVAYDHMEGTRFRHTAQFRRWRPDRDPSSCTYAQLDEPVTFDLGSILPGV